MLPNTDRPGHDANGKRQDYLSLPYNDPIRVRMRQLEEVLGTMYERQNAAQANAGGLFSGILALLAGVGGYLILGPAGVFAGAALGGAVGAAIDANIRTRYLYPAEWALAQRVFHSTLPPHKKIIITNISGAQGRNFTIPGSAIATLGTILDPILLLWLLKNPSLFSGQILVNMGDGFSDAIKYTVGRYTMPGQVLIHELTHAWQIQHENAYGFVCSAVMTQTGNSLGGSAYAVTPGQQWNQYGLEQQAALVDTWFGRGSPESHSDPYFRYIESNIRTGNPNAASLDTPLHRMPEVVARTVHPALQLSTIARLRK